MEDNIEGSKIDSSNLSYPVVIRYKGVCSGMKDRESLTRTTSAGVRNGIYDNYLIIDSALVEYQVSGVRILGGIGPFFGFNIFMNRRVRVELDLEIRNPEFEYSELKKNVLKELKKWKGWRSRDDCEELIQTASVAEKPKDLIDVLTQ